MDEREWQSSTDLQKMLNFLRAERTSGEMLESQQGRIYDRKSRLFSVACCRRLWPLLADERLRGAVLTAERHADGKATDAEMGAAVKAAHRFNHGPLGEAVYAAAMFHLGAAIFRAGAAACATAQAVACYHVRPVPPTASPYLLKELPAGAKPFRSRPRSQQAKAKAGERAAQCLLLRDIFGPTPFRPVTIAPSLLGWSDATVVKLAQGIYDERAFDRLPILADALEEAGCDDADIIGHLRRPGAVHVRGCFAVDLLLGKS